MDGWLLVASREEGLNACSGRNLCDLKNSNIRWRDYHRPFSSRPSRRSSAIAIVRPLVIMRPSPPFHIPSNTITSRILKWLPIYSRHISRRKHKQRRGTIPCLRGSQPPDLRRQIHTPSLSSFPSSIVILLSSAYCSTTSAIVAVEKGAPCSPAHPINT